MRIYIAGPYTGGDPAENTNKAIDAGHEAMDLGLDPFVPHLSHFSHARRERGYEDWMKLDLAFLEVCDILWRLPGESPGADREAARAYELGIPVVFSRVGLLEHLAKVRGEDLDAALGTIKRLCAAKAELHAQGEQLAERNRELLARWTPCTGEQG